MTLRKRRRIGLAKATRSTTEGLGADEQSLADLREEVARQELYTVIEEEKSKQAAARAESFAQKRTPFIRRIVTGFGALISVLGIGDSLRPDTPELIAKSTEVELAVFHNEGDAEKLIALGTGLIFGSQIKRKKRRRAGSGNG